MEDKNPLSSFHVPKDRPLRELKDVGFLSGMSYRIIHLRNYECVFLSFFDFTQFKVLWIVTFLYLEKIKIRRNIGKNLKI